jgi:hypothetical protein
MIHFEKGICVSKSGVVTERGSDRTTTLAQHSSSQTISPDGRFIVYEHEREWFIHDRDGGSETKLPLDDTVYNVVPSENAELVGYARKANKRKKGACSVFVFDRRLRKHHCVTKEDVHGFVADAALNTIAFMRKDDIVVIDRTVGELEPVSFDENGKAIKPHDRFALNLGLSRDGQRVSFVIGGKPYLRDRAAKKTIRAPIGHHASALFMPPDGSRLYFTCEKIRFVFDVAANEVVSAPPELGRCP